MKHYRYIYCTWNNEVRFAHRHPGNGNFVVLLEQDSRDTHSYFVRYSWHRDVRDSALFLRLMELAPKTKVKERMSGEVTFQFSDHDFTILKMFIPERE